jgi:hypothetical protein
MAFLANPFAILAVKPYIAFSFYLPLPPSSHSNSNYTTISFKNQNSLLEILPSISSIPP